MHGKQIHHLSLVSIKCMRVLSCTNAAVSQAGNWVERFDRLVVKGFRILDMWGNQVAGYSALSNNLRYQSQPLTHLCQNRLAHWGKKNIRPSFKIHKLTGIWQGLLCAQIFSLINGGFTLPALFEECVLWEIHDFLATCLHLPSGIIQFPSTYLSVHFH